MTETLNSRVCERCNVEYWFDWNDRERGWPIEFSVALCGECSEIVKKNPTPEYLLLMKVLQKERELSAVVWELEAYYRALIEAQRGPEKIALIEAQKDHEKIYGMRVFAPRWRPGDQEDAAPLGMPTVH